MVARSRHWQLAFVLLAVACLSGCGPELPFDSATVRGTVTYDGKPLDHGQVVFTPIDGTPGPPSAGEIQPDGSFQMRVGAVDAVAVGKHRVTVSCFAEQTIEQRRALAPRRSIIPEKYSRADTTPLTFEVRKGEDNAYPIELTK